MEEQKKVVENKQMYIMKHSIEPKERTYVKGWEFSFFTKA